MTMAPVVVRLLLTLQFQEAARAANLSGAGCRRQEGGLSAVMAELRSGDLSLPFVISADECNLPSKILVCQTQRASVDVHAHTAALQQKDHWVVLPQGWVYWTSVATIPMPGLTCWACRTTVASTPCCSLLAWGGLLHWLCLSTAPASCQHR